MTDRITAIDKAAARAIGAAMTEQIEHGSLGEWLAEVGIVAKTTTGTYNPDVGVFTLKVEFSLPDADRRGWERYAPLWDLSAEDFGRSFTTGGKTFTITGIDPKSRTRPVLAIGADGKTYKFEPLALRTILAKP